MTPRVEDPHEVAALRALVARPRRAAPARPDPPEPDVAPTRREPHPPGVIEIEHRANGESVWRCELPHGPSRRSTHGNRWDGAAGIEAAVRRHLAAHHPDLDVGRELATARQRPATQ